MQLELNLVKEETCSFENFPQTRYLGSKRKLLGALAEVFSTIGPDTALDPFCGTGSVAYLLKTLGVRVTASDVMESNVLGARALIVNNNVRLGARAADLALHLPHPPEEKGFIERTFAGLFFTAAENRYLDGIMRRIETLDSYERDMALWALFQACLAKRPYNLFHRANLNMRRRKVKRSFGNKTTWERPFEELFRRYAKEADRAVFDSGHQARAFVSDVLDVNPEGFDLVYLDPPYVSAKGVGVDYLDYYHFLEGLVHLDSWPGRILHKYKHKPLKGRGQNPWCDAKRIGQVFKDALLRFSESILVVSYRSDGIPSIDELTGYLKKIGKRVKLVDVGKYTYALSHNKRSREIIVVAT